MSLKGVAKAREVWGLRRTGLGSGATQMKTQPAHGGTDLGLPGGAAVDFSAMENPKGGWLSRGSQSPQ